MKSKLRFFAAAALALLLVAFTTSMASAYTGVIVNEVAKLTASDAAATDYFGYDVGVSGSTAIVGAMAADPSGLVGAGAAYIFDRDLSGVWTQTAKLAPSVVQASGRFGVAVAIYGDVAIVGADLEDTGGFADAGAAYVFYRNQGGANAWGQVARLTVAGSGFATDQFASDVDICGNTIVVGALNEDMYIPDPDHPGEQLLAVNKGAVYVFNKDAGGADAWGQVQRLTTSYTSGSNSFGQSVSVYGDTLVGGAYGGSYAGVFTDDGSGSNFTETKIIGPKGGIGGAPNFGSGVSVYGDQISAGAYTEVVGGINPGAAHVFSRDAGGADNWGEVAMVTPSDGAAGDNFASGTSLSGDLLICGAHTDDDFGTSTGAAYGFRGGALSVEVAKLLPSDAAADDMFGYRSHIDGDIVIVGAFKDDHSDIANAGSAYIFSGNQIVPEPSSIVLLVMGALALLAIRRK